MPLLTYTPEIENAVMIVHGGAAHSFYFGKDAYEHMTGEGAVNPANKKLVVVLGASHCDLYDRYDIIPVDTIAEFLRESL